MEEKLRFLGAMCNFRNEKLLLKTLQFSQTSEVRSQNMQLPIMKIAANPYGKKILWPWLKKNWSKMSKKVGYGNPLFNRIVASIAFVADDSMEKDYQKILQIRILLLEPKNSSPNIRENSNSFKILTTNEKRIQKLVWLEK